MPDAFVDDFSVVVRTARTDHKASTIDHSNAVRRKREVRIAGFELPVCAIGLLDHAYIVANIGLLVKYYQSIT